MADFKKDLAAKKKNLLDLEQHEQKYASELDTALQQYHHLEGQAQDTDLAELQKFRLSLRPEKENAATQKLQKAYAGQYDPAIMAETKQDISALLNEKIERHSVLDSIHRSNTVQKEKKVMQEAER